jgi:hypothetical protein
MSATWNPSTSLAYVDLEDPKSSSLSSFLGLLAKEWGWVDHPPNMTEFGEQLEKARTRRQKMVLCMDHFEHFANRKKDFATEFFVNLRFFCSNGWLSILTTSQESLDKFADTVGKTSPLYNLFATLRLGPFSDETSERFVSAQRSIPEFNDQEKTRILTFAQGHPLALNLACYYVLEARLSGESLDDAMVAVENEIRGMIPSWPNFAASIPN